MHPHSPVELSPDVFNADDLFMSRLQWANLIAIAIVTPLSFVLNKVWTFRAVREVNRGTTQ